MTNLQPGSAAKPHGLVDHDNPWPGLIPYTEADKSFFFGRSQEIEALLVRVKRKRTAVLYAASGVGKSSLLEAGLYPRLRAENYLPISLRMDFSTHSAPFVDQLLDAIQRSARKAGIEAPAHRDGDGAWEYFHRPNADFWNTRNRPQIPILVFDQFEEFFTLGRRSSDIEKRCETILDSIADLAEGSPPQSLQRKLDENPELAKSYVFGQHNYKILIALREDYLPDMEPLQARISDIAFNRFRLKRIDGNSALEVVDQAPHLIDTAVAEEVVRFVAAVDDSELPFEDFEIEPALLSVICRELNNRRQRNDQEKITAKLLEGSRAEILSDFYERSVADLTPAARTFIEEKLLTVSGFRDSVALENVLQHSELSQEDLDKLQDRRLLRIDSRAGHDRVELTHDRLTEVIARSRDRRRAVDERREAEKKTAAINKKLARSRVLVFAFAAFSAATVALAGYAYVAKQNSQALQDKLAIAQEAFAEQIREDAILAGEKEAALRQELDDQKARFTVWQELVERRDAGQDVSALETAVRQANAAVSASALQVEEKQRQIDDAQRDYNASFNILMQYSGSAPTGNRAQQVENQLSSLGFTIGEKIDNIATFSQNKVIYFNVAAEAPARLIARTLSQSDRTFDTQLVKAPAAWSDITIQVYNSN